MACFSLVIQSPLEAPSHAHALGFCKAALAEGHSVVRLFFYGDAIYAGLATRQTPQGENDIGQAWQHLIQQYTLDAVICIAAATRRGLLDNATAQRLQAPQGLLRPGFMLSGLGQLVEASTLADRCITFG